MRAGETKTAKGTGEEARALLTNDGKKNGNPAAEKTDVNQEKDEKTEKDAKKDAVALIRSTALSRLTVPYSAGMVVGVASAGLLVSLFGVKSGSAGSDGGPGASDAGDADAPTSFLHIGSTGIGSTGIGSTGKLNSRHQLPLNSDADLAEVSLLTQNEPHVDYNYNNVLSQPILSHPILSHPIIGESAYNVNVHDISNHDMSLLSNFKPGDAAKSTGYRLILMVIAGVTLGVAVLNHIFLPRHISAGNIGGAAGGEEKSKQS
jgi:hypothetical protein